METPEIEAAKEVAAAEIRRILETVHLKTGIILTGRIIHNSFYVEENPVPLYSGFLVELNAGKK